MNKETASRAALTSSLNISFFVQPTEESLNGFPDRRNGMRIKVISGLASLFFFFRSPFDGLDGSIELIGLVASLPLLKAGSVLYVINNAQVSVAILAFRFKGTLWFGVRLYNQLLNLAKRCPVPV